MEEVLGAVFKNDRRSLDSIVAETRDGADQAREYATPQLNVLVNVSDLERLRALSEADLVLVTDDALMRGFDYRCASGLALFLGKRLASRRAV